MKRNFQYWALCGLFLFGACQSAKKSQPVTDGTLMDTKITDTRWKLIELSGKAVADTINGKEAFLLLQTKDGRYMASGGCNGLGGTFSLLANNKIKFEQGMSTMMACEDMTIESGLNKAFLEVDNYTMASGTLSLNKGKMAPLARFKSVQGAVE